MAQVIERVAYGLTQPLLVEAPLTVLAKRAPSTGDIGYKIGQIWINTTSGASAAYILTSVVANAANWINIALASGASFTTISSTGQFTLDTTTAAANTLGNTTGTTSVSIAVGTGGFSVDGAPSSNYSIGASTTTGTFNFGGTGADTGTMTIAGGSGAQAVNIAASGTGAKAITIGATGSVDVVSIGSTTGASSLALKSGSAGIAMSGAVTSANAVTVTAGNITATNGDVVLSTATNKITLPGPVNIMSGAGAPSNGLAVNVGDMYINTTAASAVTRLYIATAASTWTNVTCAA